MATAKQERERAARGEGPLGKAPDDEPVFILRAQDCLAYDCVIKWAVLARTLGVDNDKVAEAFAIADEMLHWQTRKMPD